MNDGMCLAMADGEDLEAVEVPLNLVMLLLMLCAGKEPMAFAESVERWAEQMRQLWASAKERGEIEDDAE